MASKWTAVRYDAKKDVASLAGRLERVELPDKMWVEVVVDLDDKLEKAFTEDNGWCVKLQDASMKAAQGKIKDFAKGIKDIDAEAEGKGPQVTKQLQAEIEALQDKLFSAAAAEMKKVAEKMMDDFQQRNKELQKYRAMARTKIGVEVAIVLVEQMGSFPIPVVGQALGLVGLIKGAIAINDILYKALVSCDTLGKDIQRNVDILVKWTHDKGPGGAEAQWKLKGEGARNFMEVGLNLLSRALGLNSIPSLKNLESDIAVHAVRIQEVRQQAKELAGKVQEAVAEQDKILNKLKVYLSYDHVNKGVEKQLKKSEAALDRLIKATIAANEAADAAEKRDEKFSAALKEMQTGIKGIVKAAAVIGAVVTNVAEGAGAVEGLLDAAQDAAQEAAQAVAQEAEVAKKSEKR